MRRHRHALLSARNHDAGVAKLDRLGGKRNRAQARAAELIDADRGGFLPDPRINCGLAGRVLPLPCGQYLAEDDFRSEEHTSELQSLMRISYAVFCLKKKKNKHTKTKHNSTT